MKLKRIYCQQALSADATVELSPERSHYVQNVLRLKAGARLHVFNENDGDFRADIIELSKQSVVLNLSGAVAVKTESPCTIHLGQGLSRGERMDVVMQKATELGAASVTPVITQYCEVKLSGDRLQKKLSHWRNIAISACEQSGRTVVPMIHPPMPISEWLEQPFEGLSLVADPDSTAHLPDQKDVSNIRLLIGPEGGFSPEEVAMAQEQGFSAWFLGPRVLRTETAPIAALAILQARWGDL